MTHPSPFDAFPTQPGPPVRRPDRPRGQNARIADIVVSLLLWLVQALLVGVGVLYAPLMAMGTDACSYQSCGSENWIWVGILIAWIAGPLALLTVGGVTLYRIIGNRPAWFIVVAGIAIQVLVLALAVGTAAQAGPS
ncbi:MAG: hypothetical protein QM774_01880 [Gordonia sp. (in: high G+C Gram-positive bacteria)]|uniref:hypothetical protein n=1 Tax=Gordonia sp. (in: high G+C Gram-positive bacteria) TaxID=84139 RepID=UPI0039E64F57